jgi:hypothetical protein
MVSKALASLDAWLALADEVLREQEEQRGSPGWPGWPERRGPRAAAESGPREATS